MDVDPAASLRCWAIELELGGRIFEVPALPAADWWPVFASADLSKVLDMIVSTPEADLDEYLLEHFLNQDDLAQTLTDAAEATAGRSLHVALVLAYVANQHWASINGALVRRGFRWDAQPMGAAFDAIFSHVMEAFPDKEAQDKFLAVLENETLTGGKKAVDREKALDDFSALAGPRPTTGVKSTGAPSEGERPRTQPRSRRLPPGGRSRAPMRQRARPAGSGPPASS